MAKKIIFGVSITLNILVIILVSLSFTRKSSSLFFLDLHSDTNRYTTAASIISVPSNGADVVFGNSEFTLRAGEEAVLQFSLVVDGKQINLALETLYDRKIISIEPSGYGVIIKALQPGETALQMVASDGIRDIALIKVIE